ncbi:MAG: LacI family DNA-binding transcriptional regulator [Caldilineaceae bacterium]
MPVTIEDIARQLGTSVSTVSKALNDYSDVSSATKERILDAARELGYHPNTAARSLRAAAPTRSAWWSTIPLMWWMTIWPS